MLFYTPCSGKHTRKLQIALSFGFNATCNFNKKNSVGDIFSPCNVRVAVVSVLLLCDKFMSGKPKCRKLV